MKKFISANKTLANNVRRLMALRGWSQLELGEISGVAQTTISNIVRASTHAPGVDKVEAIAGAFGVEPWKLFLEAADVEVLVSRPLGRIVAAAMQVPEEIREILANGAELEARHAKRCEETERPAKGG